MNRAFWATFLGALLLLSGGCKKTDEKQAIRAGVMKHISSMNGLNVNNMDIVVTQATINGNTAQANVDIRAKNGDPNAQPMHLVYNLEKQGPDWVVVKGQSTGGMQHPAPGDTPPGNLPPGHPSTGGTSGQLPANHPDFNSILNSAQPQPNQQQQPSNQQSPQQKPSSNNPKPQRD
jgi:hypothetical protein